MPPTPPTTPRRAPRRGVSPARLAALLAVALVLAAASCEVDDPFTLTDDELADRIRASTPTELPPVTSVGANTMGAWVTPGAGSALAREAGSTDPILFVASGVERPDPIGTISTDCPPFQNHRYETDGYVSISGRWCSRPEIGDFKSQTLTITIQDDGNIHAAYAIGIDGGSSLNELIFRRRFVDADLFNISLDNIQNRIIALESDDFYLHGYYNATAGDSILVSDLRLDATYGLTP